MLRSTMNTIVDFMRKTTRPSLKHVLRGKLQIDFADTNIDHADGERAGTIMGLDVRQKDSLDDGIIQYYDDAGNLIATNAT